MPVHLPMLDEHAPWSLSKSDLAAKCPYAFKLRYLEKVKRASGTHAQIGIAAHEVQEFILNDMVPKVALETALNNMPNLTVKEIETVESMLGNMASFHERMQRFRKKHDVVEVFNEQKWAINRQFEPVDWKDPDAFYRGIVDYAMLTRGGYLVVMDHKSGRRHPVEKYSRQLDSYAVLGLSMYSDIKGAHAALHYIKTGDIDWHFMRKTDVIQGLLRAALVEMLSVRAAKLPGYPVTPNKFCKWCDYIEHCPTGLEKVATEKEAKRLETNRKARERNAKKRAAKKATK